MPRQQDNIKRESRENICDYVTGHKILGSCTKTTYRFDFLLVGNSSFLIFLFIVAPCISISIFQEKPTNALIFSVF
jgi:hypothetical protein